MKKIWKKYHASPKLQKVLQIFEHIYTRHVHLSPIFQNFISIRTKNVKTKKNWTENWRNIRFFSKYIIWNNN